MNTVKLQYNVLARSAAKRLVYWSWPLFLDHYFLTQDDLCMYFVYIPLYMYRIRSWAAEKKLVISCPSTFIATWWQLTD